MVSGFGRKTRRPLNGPQASRDLASFVYMASPQSENGHTRIANEILEHLILTSVKLSGREWQILLFIIRKTYGFHKKTDKISISQFKNYTKQTKTQIYKCLQTLLRLNYIKKTNKQYGFNKNWEEWGVSKLTSLKIDYKSVSELATFKVSELRHTKERRKEIIKEREIPNFSTPCPIHKSVVCLCRLGRPTASSP
jgi:phage replication O-like protein O